MNKLKSKVLVAAAVVGAGLASAAPVDAGGFAAGWKTCPAGQTISVVGVASGQWVATVAGVRTSHGNFSTPISWRITDSSARTGYWSVTVYNPGQLYSAPTAICTG